jgi:histidinol-phosphatase (PHP family)
MLYKMNFHTHTIYCDGKNTAEEMILKAIDLNFLSIGFSVHSPMFFENDYAISEEKLSEYYSEIERLKEVYSEKIEIYNGIELDKDSVDLSDYSFDYIIASVHQIHKNGNIYYVDYSADMLRECADKEFGGDFMKMIKHYYDELTDYIIDIGPDIVGHYDLIEKYNSGKALFDRDCDEYREIIEDALKLIAEKRPGQMFEINTGAMYRLKNDVIYPSAHIMSLLHKLGFEIVINSDAHSVDSLDFAFDEALNYARRFGFDHINILKNGKFSKISI